MLAEKWKNIRPFYLIIEVINDRFEPLDHRWRVAHKSWAQIGQTLLEAKNSQIVSDEREDLSCGVQFEILRSDQA